MSKKTIKPVASAIGAAMAGSMMLAGSAGAADNPFGMTELNGGYLQTAAAHMEGKCGGNMGAEKKAAEGKCGTGKCGGSMGDKKPMEGKCGGSMGDKKPMEGKCGGNMGDKKPMEGKCGGNMGAAKKAAEGKCGAGKCGGMK